MDVHGDVIKWKHFPRYWPFLRGIHRTPVNSPHKGQWRGALMLSLICTWIHSWVNNCKAGDLRRHSDHYDVSVVYMVPRGSIRRNIPQLLRKIWKLMIWYPTTFWHFFTFCKSKLRLQNPNNIRNKPPLFYIDHQTMPLRMILFHQCCQNIVFDTEAWYYMSLYLFQ